MSLDLDSNLREKGVRGAGRWAGTDAARRENALSAVFDALRRGKYGEAEEVCRKSGEAWRVATIRGARFWGYGMSRCVVFGVIWFLSLEWTIEDGSEDIAESEDVKLEGNLRRGLWKKACKAIANNVSSRFPLIFRRLLITSSLLACRLYPRTCGIRSHFGGSGERPTDVSYMGRPSVGASKSSHHLQVRSFFRLKKDNANPCKIQNRRKAEGRQRILV